MKRKVNVLNIWLMLFAIMVSFALCLGEVRVYASDDWNTTLKNAYTSSGELGKKKYTVSGGGTLQGYQIWDSTNNTIISSKFTSLTSKSQEQFVSDLNAFAMSKVNDDDDQLNSDNLATVYARLQSVNGVGTKFMNVILEDTKPDFVAANKIYKPLSSVVNVVLGVIAVMIMAFLGIVMVADIAYITLPPVRLFVADSNDGKHGSTAKVASSKIFSHDALYAVKQAEEGDDGRQALGIYFKRRVMMLILLGICLMYLVQGQLYTFVGRILDLLSGLM